MRADTAFDDELAALEQRVRPLSAAEGRHLAFAIVTELVGQLVGQPLGAVYVLRMADVVLLVAELRRTLYDGGQLVPWHEHAAASVQQRADRLHARLFSVVGPRGTWPDELRLPADAAEAVRRACEPDAVRMLPLLFSGARACLVRACATPTKLDDLLDEAVRQSAHDTAVLFGPAVAEEASP